MEYGVDIRRVGIRGAGEHPGDHGSMSPLKSIFFLGAHLPGDSQDIICRERQEHAEHRENDDDEDLYPDRHGSGLEKKKRGPKPWRTSFGGTPRKG